MGSEDEALPALKALADEYRSRCLWFLRPDYYPESVLEWSRVLEYIERHGDLTAFQRVAVLRPWLSRLSNADSAGS